MTRNDDDPMNYPLLRKGEPAIADDSTMTVNVGGEGNQVCLRIGDCFDPRRDLQLTMPLHLNDIIWIQPQKNVFDHRTISC